MLCGSMTDACGSNISCGACSAGYVCGMGGRACLRMNVIPVWVGTESAVTPQWDATTLLVWALPVAVALSAVLLGAVLLSFCCVKRARRQAAIQATMARIHAATASHNTSLASFTECQQEQLPVQEHTSQAQVILVSPATLEESLPPHPAFTEATR